MNFFKWAFSTHLKCFLPMVFQPYSLFELTFFKNTNDQNYFIKFSFFFSRFSPTYLSVMIPQKYKISNLLPCNLNPCSIYLIERTCVALPINKFKTNSPTCPATAQIFCTSMIAYPVLASSSHHHPNYIHMCFK